MAGGAGHAVQDAELRDIHSQRPGRISSKQAVLVINDSGYWSWVRPL